MKKEIIKKSWKGALWVVVLCSFALPLGYLIYKIGVAPSEASYKGERIVTDYVLMLVSSLLGIVAMLLPKILSKKKKIEIPTFMYVSYVLFLYCGIFLGEVRSFFYRIDHWDTVLHAFSGMMLGALGFSIIDIINKSNKVYMKLSPIFVAIFAFGFSVSLGVIWEVWEFGLDSTLGTNMQKYAIEGGEKLVGHEALKDTMEDLTVDCGSALLMSSIGYFLIKYNTSVVEHYQIRKVVDETVQDEDENENENEKRLTS